LVSYFLTIKYLNSATIREPFEAWGCCNQQVAAIAVLFPSMFQILAAVTISNFEQVTSCQTSCLITSASLDEWTKIIAVGPIPTPALILLSFFC
jgi:hypothetical protein